MGGEAIPTDPQLEICICAAVITDDGTVYRGHRHGDAMRTAVKHGYRPARADQQGFVTSRNRYVSREEGRKLQDAAGIPSADPEGYRGRTLFSEDLYSTPSIAVAPPDTEKA